MALPRAPPLQDVLLDQAEVVGHHEYRILLEIVQDRSVGTEPEQFRLQDERASAVVAVLEGVHLNEGGHQTSERSEHRPHLIARAHRPRDSLVERTRVRWTEHAADAMRVERSVVLREMVLEGGALHAGGHIAMIIGAVARDGPRQLLANRTSFRIYEGGLAADGLPFCRLRAVRAETRAA